MTTIRVMLVDDHRLLRETLRERLEREPGLDVVASVGDAEAALTAARSHEPDVVLMDVEMPGLICFDAARQIAAAVPNARLIFLSAHLQDRYIEQALEVGALGYLTKAEPAERVVTAIYDAMRGRSCFSSEVRARLVVGPDRARLAAGTSTRLANLTGRELEVVRYLARGMPKRDIADTMHISETTVAKHVQNVMNKLEIHDRVELARFALREGLVEP